MTNCPCGSNKELDNCCKPFITGAALPNTPEELMRSRYTAYTVGAIDYIEQTMLPPASNGFDKRDALAWAQQTDWTGLEVLASESHDTSGTVEFRSHFIFEKKNYTMHEISEFIKKDGRWYYTDGKKPAPLQPVRNNKIPRNDPCPCGSTKKYKKCCGNN